MLTVSKPNGEVRKYLDAIGLGHLEEFTLPREQVEAAERESIQQHPDESQEQIHACAVTRVAHRVYAQLPVSAPEEQKPQVAINRLASKVELLIGELGKQHRESTEQRAAVGKSMEESIANLSGVTDRNTAALMVVLRECLGWVQSQVQISEESIRTQIESFRPSRRRVIWEVCLVSVSMVNHWGHSVILPTK